MVRLTIAVLAALALAAPAAAEPYFGFNDNAPLTGDLTPSQDARLLARAGANSSRVTVDWTYVEPARGYLNFDLIDQIYRAQTRRGIRPVLIVTGAPKWAWRRWSFCLRGRTCHYPPDLVHDAAWRRFAGETARRYPLAAAIEVWNEPNLSGFWGGSPDPARYTELLRSAHDAVKAENPDMPVLGASLAGIRGDHVTPSAMSMRPFLTGMYGAGAAGVMDGISLHPYPKEGLVARSYEAIDEVVGTRDAFGDDSPLWLTEVGLSTAAGFSEQQQADVLGELVPALLRRPDVRGVWVHTLIDPVRRKVGGPEGGFGIVAGPGRPKLAFCVLARCTRVASQ
jgi:hypothetical protein